MYKFLVQVFYQIHALQLLSPFCGLHFHFLDVILFEVQLLIFYDFQHICVCVCVYVYVYIFLLLLVLFGVISQNAFPNSESQTFSSVFYSKKFVVLVVKFRSELLLLFSH